ncbi:MAG: hypothetical protein K6T85_04750 [Gorillibacterium sp.]|nr:hypothetical protein [Gorillibacterium sp.]
MYRKLKEKAEWTGFQEARPYGPKYDLRTDFVMVYGISEDLPLRIEGWREKGYTVHLMTGVSWGEYQDYLYGRFDGRDHWDEAQKDQGGKLIVHGPEVPYMVPTISFAEYLATFIKKAIDSGVEAIHMEEPEFWVAGGYSAAFKREWLNYYSEEWIPPHASADAQYRASKLKAYLYYRALDRICSQMKEYALVTYSRTVRFYVPTHSLINYTQWQIVSPEALLVNMPAIDGFIAQVWTGTSRTQNVYQGVRRERTFETAFLEYGVMQELVRGTGREMWFLHDPIEDDPNYSWSDYKPNYQATVVASLLHPGVKQYEVCPWPRRVFEGAYPKEDGTGKESIPAEYATILLTVMNVLRDMHHWEEEPNNAVTPGVGLLLANSAMYQRGDILGDDSSLKYDGTSSVAGLTEKQQEKLNWSAFYGMALPLVKHGIPLRPVQLDNISAFPGYLDDYRVLLLSYELMKPEHLAIHQVLSQWVREGGILVYFGDGSDPFHQVKEWWNQSKKRYDRPEEHLFEALGLGVKPEAGEYKVGEGGVIFYCIHPAELAASVDGAELVRESVRRALVMRGETEGLQESNHLSIKRGPYLITRVMDESCGEESIHYEGCFIDLFDSELMVRRDVILRSGDNSLLYDLNAEGHSSPVVASSSRIRDERTEGGRLCFYSEAPKGITVSTRIRQNSRPGRITMDGKLCESHWDEESQTLLLRYPGKPEGTEIVVESVSER